MESYGEKDYRLLLDDLQKAENEGKFDKQRTYLSHGDKTIASGFVTFMWEHGIEMYSTIVDKGRGYTEYMFKHRV